MYNSFYYIVSCLDIDIALFSQVVQIVAYSSYDALSEYLSNVVLLPNCIYI